MTGEEIDKLIGEMHNLVNHASKRYGMYDNEAATMLIVWAKLRDHLPHAGEVHVTWSTDDVRAVLEDRLDVPVDTLTEAECAHVLDQVVHEHDAEVGINLGVLEYWVLRLYPEKFPRKD